VFERRPVSFLLPAGQSRRRLLWWGGAGALVAVLLLVGGWLAWTAQHARAEMLAARAELPAVRAAVMAGDGTGVRRLENVRRHARVADELTHDPVWSAVGVLPGLGSPIATTQGLTHAVRALAEQAMPPLVVTADTLHPAKLLSGGRLDVAALRRTAPALSDAAQTLRAQRDAVTGLSPSWFGPVADARTQLESELTSLTDTSAAAADAARLLPPMLGLDGPRRYFVAFQNPAEARASGGLLDAFVIVAADRGRVQVERVGANTQLPALSGEVTSGLDPEYVKRYAPIGATSDWLEGNVSPHFPDVAATWEAMWKQATGQQLDGVVALTPQALSAVLAATGPVTAPVVGTVDARRIESLVLHDQYTMPELGNQRKSVMLGVGEAVIEALLNGRAPAGTLVTGLRGAARDGEILVQSRMPAEQAQLVADGIGGAVDETDGPYAQAVVLNAAGSKLDSWLSTTLDYRVTACTAASRTVEVIVTLRNDAPVKGLPSYVTIRSDYPGYPVVPSQNRDELEVLLTRGAKLQRATLDGVPMVVAPAEGQLPDTLPDGAATTFLQQGQTRGRPSYWMDLELVPGQPRTVVLVVTEPPSNESPVLPRQVMVRPEVVRSQLRDCPAGAGPGETAR
jgi:hypothetical protein